MSCWPTQQWSLFRGNVFTLEFFIALSCFKTNLMGYILETIVGPLKLSFFFTSTIVYDIKKNPSRCLFVTMCLRTQESSCSNLLKIVFYFPNTKRLRHGDKVWHFEICSQQLWVLRSANLGSHSSCLDVHHFLASCTYRMHACTNRSQGCNVLNVKGCSICMMRISLWLYKLQLPIGWFRLYISDGYYLAQKTLQIFGHCLFKKRNCSLGYWRRPKSCWGFVRISFQATLIVIFCQRNTVVRHDTAHWLFRN